MRTIVTPPPENGEKPGTTLSGGMNSTGDVTDRNLCLGRGNNLPVVVLGRTGSRCRRRPHQPLEDCVDVLPIAAVQGRGVVVLQ